MIERLGTQTAAILIIFIIFLGGLFLFATVGKLFFYWWARRIKTSFSGREVLDFLLVNNKLSGAKIKQKLFPWRSSFYAYRAKTQTFSLATSTLEQENLHASWLVSQAVVYANEQAHQTRNLYRWQYLGLGLLNLLLYCLFLGMMLLTFLPVVDVNQKVALGYWISVEALSIVGWIIMLVIVFWWINVTMNFNESLEAQIKKLNNQELNYQFKNFLNVAAYFPFSNRTIF